MATTNFTAGTVIASPWLNDVNNLTYNLTGAAGVVPATVAQLRTNIGAAASASPTITGTMTASAANFSGAVALNSTAAAANGITVGNVAQAGSTILDYYDEGTFSPRLAFGGATTGWVLTGTGIWTRVGRVVYVSGSASYTTKGSATGNMQVTGLPFTSNNSENHFITVVLLNTVSALAGAPNGYVQFNSSLINIGCNDTLNAFTQLTHANCVAGGPPWTSVMFSGFYFV